MYEEWLVEINGNIKTIWTWNQLNDVYGLSIYSTGIHNGYYRQNNGTIPENIYVNVIKKLREIE